MSTATLRGTDRILRFTTWLSAFIVPFLVVASVLLYVLPTHTDQLFAWTINPPLSAMFLASAYLGGIWFFAQVLRQRAWHRIRYGFPAVVVFATLASIATFLHWDRFHHGTLTFIVWTILYITTPFLTLAALLLNRGADDHAFDERDYRMPLAPRLALAIVGLLSWVAGIILFIDPSLLIDTWAWQLTPLTARIVGAVLTLPGTVNVWLLFDARWSAFKPTFQASMVALVFLVAALAICAGQLEPGRPSTPLLVVGLACSLVAYLAFYVYCEREVRVRTR